MFTLTVKDPVDDFIDQTCLLPAVVLDAVVHELCDFFSLKNDPAAEKMYLRLRSEDIQEEMEEKSGQCFAHYPGFKKSMLVEDPRPVYYSFMRHWVAAAVKKHFPVQFRDLPSTFKVGQPL